MACTCAISIRSGDDVIVVDSCRERALAKGGNMMVDVLLNGELTSGTKILSENNGRKIKVIHSDVTCELTMDKMQCNSVTEI